MLNIELARKYARAIFEIALEEDRLEDYGRELASVKADLETSAELRAFLANPNVQLTGKKELLTRLFAEEVSANTLNFLRLLVDKRRIQLFDAIEEIYTQLSNEKRGIVVADVWTAKGISTEQQAALSDKLQSVMGKQVSLRLHEDKSLIGGMAIRMGDRLIDGSVKGKLTAMTADLMAK